MNEPHKAIALDALEGLTVNVPRLSEITPAGLTDEQLQEMEAVGDACDSVLRRYVTLFFYLSSVCELNDEKCILLYPPSLRCSFLSWF